jgi:CheY-like chemotaxis protein
MLAREIRKLPAREALPLVLLSSIGRTPEMEDAGLFASCLAKPAKPPQLLAIIEKHIGTPHVESLLPDLVMPASDETAHSDRILLAEDNGVNQKVALHMLKRLGYRADVAGNGREVIAALEQRPYDIILMDVQMPEMDGMEATRFIRANHPGGHPAPWIIALTANAMEGDQQACAEAGMNDYLSKPIKKSDLEIILIRAHNAVIHRKGDGNHA